MAEELLCGKSWIAKTNQRLDSAEFVGTAIALTRAAGSDQVYVISRCTR